jgi:hypothetical protein
MGIIKCSVMTQTWITRAFYWVFNSQNSRQISGKFAGVLRRYWCDLGSKANVIYDLGSWMSLRTTILVHFKGKGHFNFTKLGDRKILRVRGTLWKWEMLKKRKIYLQVTRSLTDITN